MGVEVVAVFAAAIISFLYLAKQLASEHRRRNVERIAKQHWTEQKAVRDWVRWYKDQAEIDEQKRKHPLEQEEAPPPPKVERVVIGFGDDGEMIFGDVEVEEE